MKLMPTVRDAAHTSTAPPLMTRPVRRSDRRGRGATATAQPHPSWAAAHAANIHTSSESPWWLPAAAPCTSPAAADPTAAATTAGRAPALIPVGRVALVSVIDIS